MSPRLPDAASALTWGRLPTSVDRAEPESGRAARSGAEARRPMTVTILRPNGTIDLYRATSVVGVGSAVVLTGIEGEPTVQRTVREFRTITIEAED